MSFNPGLKAGMILTNKEIGELFKSTNVSDLLYID